MFLNFDVHFQSHIINYQKKLVGTNYLNLIQSTAGLSPIIINPYPSSYKKYSPPLMLPCCPHHMRTVSASSDPLWEPSGIGGQFHLTAQYLFIPPVRRIPLNKLISLSKSHSLPNKQQISCNHQIQASFVAFFFATISFFLNFGVLVHMLC